MSIQGLQVRAQLGGGTAARGAARTLGPGEGLDAELTAVLFTPGGRVAGVSRERGVAFAQPRSGTRPAARYPQGQGGRLGYTNNRAVNDSLGLLRQDGAAPPGRGWTWDGFKATAQEAVLAS